MLATGTLTTDAIGAPESIIAAYICRKITLREEDGGATVGFVIRAPYSGSAARTYAPGESAVFERRNSQACFNQNELIAYIESLSGTLVLEVLYE